MRMLSLLTGLVAVSARLTDPVPDEAAPSGETRWHPDGTLIKMQESPTVYLLEDGAARPFMDEQAFLSRGYDFADVTPVSADEYACYTEGAGISGVADIRAVYDGVDVWLIVENASSIVKARVPGVAWKPILQSWGEEVASTNDLPRATSDQDFDGATDEGTVGFRDGTIIKEPSPDVYVVSNGVAMPIADWDTYMALGWEHREILQVDTGVVSNAMTSVGDCEADVDCLTLSRVQTCGEAAGEDTGDTAETGDTGGDSADTGDTGGDTADSGDSGEDTSDSGDTGEEPSDGEESEEGEPTE